MGAIEKMPTNQGWLNGETYASAVMSLEQAKQAYGVIRRITKEVLQEGTDYARIPGTKNPSLLKPGAENMLRFFGLGHRIQLVDSVKDWEGGFFYFAYRVTIHKTMPDGSEVVLAECEGSANSRESRYADRWVPQWKLGEYDITDVSGLQSRTNTNHRGEYQEYKLQNKDPYTLVNTLQKMAIKRALVGATLQATGASGLFTQDLEDMEGAFTGDGKGQATNSRRYEKQKESSKPKTNRGQSKRQQGKEPEQKESGQGDRITGQQKNAIYKIAESKGVSGDGIETVCQGQFGMSLGELDKANASDLIKLLNKIDPDELQSLADSYMNPGGEESDGEIIDISDDELPF